MQWRLGMAGKGLPGRILTAAAGAVLLVLALTFSLLLFAVAAAGGLLVWLYLSWKARGLRRQMRAQPAGGRVFEGEVVREPEPGARRIAPRPEN